MNPTQPTQPSVTRPNLDMIDTHCPCGSGFNYQACCGRFHANTAPAPTAEALMRSRFSAFCLKNADYVLATWDASTRPATLDFAGDTTQWQRLEITQTQKGLAGDTMGKVSFNAYFLQDGQESVMSETSRFKKTDGKWFYVDGIVKYAQQAHSRNGLCPCGSGKKFKRCCMK